MPNDFVLVFTAPLKGGGVSATALAEFYVCPRRFYLRRMLGARESMAAKRGREMHKRVAMGWGKPVAMGLEEALELYQRGERLVGVNVGVNGGGVRGIMDELRLWENVEVVEYKSRMSEAAKIQTIAYGYALSFYDVFPVLTVRDVSNREVLWEARLSGRHERIVRGLLRRMKRAVLRMDFPAQEGEWCERCPFRRVCSEVGVFKDVGVEDYGGEGGR